MNCQELQKKFIPFIDDQLTISDLEAFLHHLNNCKECREEYEIYYTIIMGMRYLDEEKYSEDFRIDSEQKLRSAMDYLVKYKILRVEKLLLFGVLCMGMILLL